MQAYQRTHLQFDDLDLVRDNGRFVPFVQRIVEQLDCSFMKLVRKPGPFERERHDQNASLPLPVCYSVKRDGENIEHMNANGVQNCLDDRGDEVTAVRVPVLVSCPDVTLLNRTQRGGVLVRVANVWYDRNSRPPL